MNKLLYALLCSITLINALQIPTPETVLKDWEEHYKENPKKTCENLRNQPKVKYIGQLDDALGKKKEKLVDKQNLELSKPKHVVRTCLHSSLAALFSGFGAYNLYYNSNSPYAIAYWHSMGIGLAAFLPKALHHVRKWYNYQEHVAARLTRNNDLYTHLQANPHYIDRSA